MKDKLRTHMKLINILFCGIFLSIVLLSYDSLDDDQKFVMNLFGWGIALINAITELILFKTLRLVENKKNDGE